MIVQPTRLPDVLRIVPDLHPDSRGWLVETWRSERYAAHGLPADLVQDNLVFSVRGVLRGLHWQHPEGQGKLVQALSGEVFDVAVDVQFGSPTFGQWVGCRLSSEERTQVWVPAGFAHGYCVLSETALVSYKCSAPYRPAHEHCLHHADPDVGVAWPIAAPVVSAKDDAGLRLRDLDRGWLPTHAPTTPSDAPHPARPSA